MPGGVPRDEVRSSVMRLLRQRREPICDACIERARLRHQDRQSRQQRIHADRQHPARAGPLSRLRQVEAGQRRRLTGGAGSDGADYSAAIRIASRCSSSTEFDGAAGVSPWPAAAAASSLRLGRTRMSNSQEMPRETSSMIE